MKKKSKNSLRLNFSILILALILGHDLFAAQALPPAGQACIACHGPNGESLNALWPNLAGQKKDYLEKQLKDFKAGTRKDPLMSPIAQTLSDADISTLADYFSKLNTVKK